MNDITEDILNILSHTQKVQNTDGFRLIIKRQTEHKIQYTEVFVWESDRLDENHFTITIVMESDFDMTSVTNTVKLISVSSVVASFNYVKELSYDLILSRSLINLLKEVLGVCLH